MWYRFRLQCSMGTRCVLNFSNTRGDVDSLYMKNSLCQGDWQMGMSNAEQMQINRHCEQSEAISTAVVCVCFFLLTRLSEKLSV